MKSKIKPLMDAGRRLFEEDECAPDGESLEHAWCRLFGEPLPEHFVEREDWGDCTVTLYRNGRIACIGPPRCGWTAIYVADVGVEPSL